MGAVSGKREASSTGRAVLAFWVTIATCGFMILVGVLALVAREVNYLRLPLSIAMGLLLIAGGLIIIRDSYGWGTRYYEFTIQLPMPDFYRKMNCRDYRLLSGGSYAIGGIVWLSVAALSVVK